MKNIRIVSLLLLLSSSISSNYLDESYRNSELQEDDLNYEQQDELDDVNEEDWQIMENLGIYELEPKNWPYKCQIFKNKQRGFQICKNYFHELLNKIDHLYPCERKDEVRKYLINEIYLSYNKIEPRSFHSSQILQKELEEIEKEIEGIKNSKSREKIAAEMEAEYNSRSRFNDAKKKDIGMMNRIQSTSQFNVLFPFKGKKELEVKYKSPLFKSNVKQEDINMMNRIKSTSQLDVLFPFNRESLAKRAQNESIDFTENESTDFTEVD